MSGVLELLGKNIKNVLRSRSGALIVILGPLIVMFLAGLAFDNTGVYSVKVGVYDPVGDNVTSLFIDGLRAKFKVQEFSSEDECSQSIRDSQANACMVFPANFEVGVSGKNELRFYVDYSRMNLVYAILSLINEEVSEKSLSTSEDLTRTLIDAIDYTQKRIRDQRESIVKLTTENELINKNSQDLLAELSDIDLRFDSQGLPVDNVSSSKTQVKQWLDNALSLGERGLSEAIKFIDTADELVKSSDASNDAKAQLLASFESSVDSIERLKEDLSKTRELSLASFERFDSSMSGLVGGIEQLRSRLDSAETSRQFSIRVLESLKVLLDKSIISVVSVQQALNDIDNKLRSIEITDPESISQPIVTRIKPVVQEHSYLNYLFPVLLVLVVMFTALLLTPTMVLLERNSPASFRSYLTPAKDSDYVLSDFATAFIILLIQVCVILAIVGVFFSADAVASIPKALFLLVLSSSLFILIGLIVGYSCRSEETATLAAVSIGAIFLFLSDVIVPLESMPDVFAYIASFNPYVISSSLVRRALIFDSSIVSLLPDVLILVGYIIAAALIASGAYMMTRLHSVQEVARRLKPVMTYLPVERRSRSRKGEGKSRKSI
ncbi:hypothetical protein D6825_02265 [Candidatus Woesearchaeota archaeon]|nr:MAG: hypothetical protein D6825_02265 [Candidatus Woesearchaeota archaeon]